MRVFLFGTADKLAVKVIEGREQSDRSMSYVVMRSGTYMTNTQWQAGLRTLKRLTLGLFVTAKHKGLLRRVEVQTYNIQNLVSKFGSFDSLNVRSRCGLRSLALHIRCTLAADIRE